MKHLFIINPRSFNKAEEMNKVITDCENIFGTADRDNYKTYISRYRRDAVAVVYSYLSDIPADETVRVYAIGGDGILFDCLNGIVDFPNAELTSVPYGYANDFVRAFGEGVKSAFRDIKKLSASPSRPVDIIRCGANYAINGVNIGVGGQSILYANAILRQSSNKLISKIVPQIYKLAAIKAVLDKEVREQEYKIYVDGEYVSDSFANIHVANGPCNGKTMTPSPYAIADDGLLDVITIRSVKASKFVEVVRDYERGRFEKDKERYVYKRGKVVEVQSESPLLVEMDGEAFMADEMKFEIIAGGINFFAPENIWFADYSYMAKKGNKGRQKV